jgi:hypothetical protein
MWDTFYCAFTDESQVSAEYNPAQWSKQELRDIVMLLWAPMLRRNVMEIVHQRIRNNVWDNTCGPNDRAIEKKMDERYERHVRYFYDACKRNAVSISS